MLNRLNKQNDKIKEKSIDHTSCHVSFRDKIKETHGLINLSESLSEQNTRKLSSNSPLKHGTQSAIGNVTT